MATEVANSDQAAPTNLNANQDAPLYRPRILGLILDVKTRWNSTYSMLKRANDLRSGIEMFIATDNSLKILNLCNEEWETVGKIVSLLKPLYLATMHRSKSKYPSITTTLPTYMALIKVNPPTSFTHIKVYTLRPNKLYIQEIQKTAVRYPTLKAVATEMLEKLNQYYESACSKTVYTVAVVLDPRLNISFFKNLSEFKDVRQKFKTEAEKYEKHSEQPTAVTSDEDGWMESIYKKRKLSSLDAEIKSYFREELLEKDADPIAFWKLKASIYPILSCMAKDYLSIPSTSTPSERAFSKGRLIIQHTRASLSADKIRALMCLSSWIYHGLSF